jgi:predicted urease superfamily metal-dependent hydrolase
MATKAKSVKALDLLKSNKTVSERAENYIVSVKRNIQRDVIDSITAKKEAMEDELFELTNFNLETDVNRGYQQMTKESVEQRFKKIIDRGI